MQASASQVSRSDVVNASGQEGLATVAGESLSAQGNSPKGRARQHRRIVRGLQRDRVRLKERRAAAAALADELHLTAEGLGHRSAAHCAADRRQPIWLAS